METMKKVLLIVFFLLSAIFLSACGLPWQKKAALQVSSIPKATVYIEGEEKGTTPFQDEKLSPGEITLKLVPETTTVNLNPWERKVKLVGGVMTVVNWEFGQNEQASAGEVLTLEKSKNKETATLSVVSVPDSAVVYLDGEAKSFTPLRLDQITAGEREIVITSTGFTNRTISAKLIDGYELTANVKLAKMDESKTETGTEKEEEKEGEKKEVTPTPKEEAKATTAPTPTGPTPTPPERPYVKIKDTPTDWLRVREKAEVSDSSKELTKVYPGEMYPLLDEEGGWYKIRFGEDEEGWISGKYAEKYE